MAAAKQYGLEAPVLELADPKDLANTLDVVNSVVKVSNVCGSVTAETGPLLNLIRDKGAEGKRVSALFIPRISVGVGEGSGTPTVPEYPAVQMAGTMCVLLFCHLGIIASLPLAFYNAAHQLMKFTGFFFRPGSPSAAPKVTYETTHIQHVITTVQNSIFDFNMNSFEVGVQEMYQMLNNMGQQGWSLSAVFDDPSELYDGNPQTYRSPLMMVLQRPTDPSQLVVKSFVPVTVPVLVQMAAGCCQPPNVTSQMPGLDSVLAQASARRFRLAGCYMPKNIRNSGGCNQQFEQECNLIFEFGQQEYYRFAAVPCKWDYAMPHCCSPQGCMPSVDDLFKMKSVVDTVNAWVAKGWETAAVVNLPGMSQECCGHTMTNEVLVIFQAVMDPPAQAPPPLTQPGTAAPPPQTMPGSGSVEMQAMPPGHVEAIQCPNCGMQLQNPPGQVAVTCPGCNTQMMTPA